MATEQGEVRFEAGGATHLLKYGINALCALEDEFDCSIQEIGSKLSGSEGRPVRIKDLRSIFRAGLIEGWPDGEPSHIEAGQLFDQLGMRDAERVIGEAFVAAFPDAVASKPGARGGNPRKK